MSEPWDWENTRGGIPPNPPKHTIIRGGAPVTAKFAQECGTDAYGANAPEPIKICRQWIEEKKTAS
jgi:hypothetical protein